MLSFRARLSMPEPMVALPWGSRSITSTRWPTLARPAARLTVVVVLPTPPFWLATQKIFAMFALLADRELDAEADEEHTRDLFQHAADQGVGAHALRQEVREQHGAQAIGKGQHRDGGGHHAEGEHALVPRRVDEQRKEGHVEDDGLGVQQGDEEGLLEIVVRLDVQDRR